MRLATVSLAVAALVGSASAACAITPLAATVTIPVTPNAGFHYTEIKGLYTYTVTSASTCNYSDAQMGNLGIKVSNVAITANKNNSEIFQIKKMNGVWFLQIDSYLCTGWGADISNDKPFTLYDSTSTDSGATGSILVNCVSQVAAIDTVRTQKVTIAELDEDAATSGVKAWPPKSEISAAWAPKQEYWTKAELGAVFLKTSEMATDFWLEAEKISTQALTYSRTEMNEKFAIKSTLTLGTAVASTYALKSKHMTKAAIEAKFVTKKAAKQLAELDGIDGRNLWDTDTDLIDVDFAVKEWCVLFICW